MTQCSVSRRSCQCDPAPSVLQEGRLPASRGPTKLRGRLGVHVAPNWARCAGTSTRTKYFSKAWSPKLFTHGGPKAPQRGDHGRHTVQGVQTPGRPSGYVGFCTAVGARAEPRVANARCCYELLAAVAALIRPRAPYRPLRARWGWCTNSMGVVHSSPQLPSSCRGAPQLPGCSCLACLLTSQWMQTSPHRCEVLEQEPHRVHPPETTACLARRQAVSSSRDGIEPAPSLVWHGDAAMGLGLSQDA